MKRFLPFLLGMLLLVQACTGQKPADLKNATTPRHAVKASCSSMVFEGQVLSQKNILNIFDCSGWNKKYPDLDLAIRNADEHSIDNAFKLINDNFFNTKAKRKAFYEVVANAESRGEMKTLASLLEKSLSDHKFLTQIHKAINSEQLNLSERSTFMKAISDSNEENLKAVRALKNIGKAYELNKPVINALLTDEDKEKLVTKIGAVLGDLSRNMNDKSWNYLSKVVQDADSPIQKWAIQGTNGNLNILLDVIEEPNFYHDVSFLKNSLNTGIRCNNRASTQDFNINIGQELKHKIESLKNDNKEAFERMLLHGLTKYLAFQEFCEEKVQKQGITSFYMVLKHAFSVLPSTHDFNFLKRIHQIFGEDRFVFLSFLSSQSFSGLRDLLMDLKDDGRDEQLVRSLYETLSEFSADDLKTFAGFVNEIGQTNSNTKSWHKSWSKLWYGLSSKDQNDFISFMGLFLSDKLNASDAVSFIETVLVAFPDFSPALANQLADQGFQNDLRYIVEILAEEKVQEQLGTFLSNKGLFEFIEIMTQEYVAPKLPNRQLEQSNKPVITYVETPQSQASVKTRYCFEELTQTYEADSSYYNLVNTLPEVCLSILGEAGFVGQIYLWMNSSDRYFRQLYQVDDFHTGTGVWSPGMLQFIFSTAVKADQALKNSQGKTGIKDNIDEIHRVLTDVRLLETFHQFSQIYGKVDEKLQLDARMLNFVNLKSDQELNQITSDGIKLLKKNRPYVDLAIKPTSCQDLSANLGANPCLSPDQQSDSLVDILRILKRKNQADKSLVKELVTWIHPAGGVKLPFRKTTQYIHHASIDETIRFLYDLSSEQTSKKIIYHKKNSSMPVEGTTIDRLEIIIRDIGFSNNFYGAYFKNMVASASNYRKDVTDSEKLLKVLDGSGRLLRGFTLPDDSKYRLKNARQAYTSLIELSDNYVQPDGSSKTYGPFIQSMLAAVAESSKVSTQDFNPYRFPKGSVTEGHNGIFLTKVVEMSGLRHLSSFVRAHFDANLTALDSKEFKQINKNLIGRHDLIKIQNGLQSILDKYLDNDRNQINLMITDLVTFMAKLNPKDQKLLEEILLKMLVLLSDERVSTSNIEKLSQIIELSIEMWPEIREVISATNDQSELLKLLNQVMDSLIQNPDEINRITSTLIASNLLNAQDLRDLLTDSHFTGQLSAFINQLVTLHDFDSELNWGETLEAMFSPSNMQWEALKTWLQVALGVTEHKLTVSLLVSFLGEKNTDGYRLKVIMDELFLEHRPQLEQFLSETFKSLEFKPD